MRRVGPSREQSGKNPKARRGQHSSRAGWMSERGRVGWDGRSVRDDTSLSVKRTTVLSVNDERDMGWVRGGAFASWVSVKERLSSQSVTRGTRSVRDCIARDGVGREDRCEIMRCSKG